MEVDDEMMFGWKGTFGVTPWCNAFMKNISSNWDAFVSIVSDSV